MTLEQAKKKILYTINSANETADKFIIDDRNIIDHDFAWYIPFVLEIPTDEVLVGAWWGFFVDKNTEEIFQPGSAFPLEKWLFSFKIGLRYDKYDLSIVSIRDKSQSLQLLEKLHLLYYIEEIEGGTVWKIPKSFSTKMLTERLNNLPATFHNQKLTLKIDIFEQIINSRAFDFRLVQNVSPDKIIGENLTQKDNH